MLSFSLFSWPKNHWHLWDFDWPSLPTLRLWFWEVFQPQWDQFCWPSCAELWLRCSYWLSITFTHRDLLPSLQIIHLFLIAIYLKQLHGFYRFHYILNQNHSMFILCFFKFGRSWLRPPRFSWLGSNRIFQHIGTRNWKLRQPSNSIVKSTPGFHWIILG